MESCDQSQAASPFPVIIVSEHFGHEVNCQPQVVDSSSHHPQERLHSSDDLKQQASLADRRLSNLISLYNLSPSGTTSSSKTPLAEVDRESNLEISFADFTLDLDKNISTSPSPPSSSCISVRDADGEGVVPADAVILPSITRPYMNIFRLLAVSLLNFANGLGDSAPGALIPSIEK